MFGPDLIFMFVVVYGMALISLIVAIKQWLAEKREQGKHGDPIRHNSHIIFFN